ncbi:MAG TPA: NAD(P)H nitroreductase [Actinophytocola sp.]|uniref:NAD(P)H nitroreductase n=1 Tax=Actinophytocola sp. TaxID=1872138 RepID=UPI002DDD46DF|nr:NAD(P)H nitroreductase [Actinophytocola sp.]HEV2778328.1 NAD(P)H nitroreductase [Actinophytocola sp.]
MTRFLDRDTVYAALELAVRAPSVRNSQPWRFRVGRGSIDLYADATRLPATDGRDLLISCGAALHHLRIGLTALGWLPATYRLPDPRRPDHLASIETVPRLPARADVTLAVSIPRRRTDRRAYGPLEVSGARIAELTHLAGAEGAQLRVVHPGDARARLLSVLPDLHRSSVYALARAGPALRRDHVESEEDGVGTLLVLGMGADSRLAWLRAGEATSAVLLAATRRRLATCALTEPLDTPGTRDLVRAGVLGGGSVPQLVLRVGWPADDPDPFPATGRRPISDVVDWATG